MTEIKLECCCGSENYDGHCLKDRCPHYRQAQEEVSSSWPYVGTGFGNLHGNPKHSHFLSKVRENLKDKKKGK